MGLYYLQSRYYDPELCRFLNADAYVSTGQGELGNNMFAYCANNPVINFDPAGDQSSSRLINQFFLEIGYDAGCAAIGLGLATSLFATSSFEEYRDRIVSNLRWEIYDYSKMLRQLLVFVPNSMPNVHHIVPVGNFLSRNATTYMQIQEMHTILENAGINRYVDPMNLMLVSMKTHGTLHTDMYIAHVYSYIKNTDGSKEEIYFALFLLRIEIAAKDGYAIGY